MSLQDRSVLTFATINAEIVKMEYAVRGAIPTRATELIRELKAGEKKPFDEVILANIGDYQAMGESPITYIRQVLSASLNPSAAYADSRLPEDVKERVRLLLSYCGGQSVGSYSDSSGVEIVRRHVAEYLEDRDAVPSDWRSVVLTYGSSDGVKCILSLINSSSTDGIQTGVMVPIPYDPIYSATLSELGMQLVPYYLDEDIEWSLDIKELERAHQSAQSHCKPKAIVIINPGNPTGSVLTKENIAEIIRFARANNLLIIADEVYQQNIWKEGAKFYSFKQVMAEIGIELELASLMSASKGYFGECGLRGGCIELAHFDPQVLAAFIKPISARICCSLVGQFAIGCVVRPPKPGEASYELFAKERDNVLATLKDRAELTTRTLNSLPGIKCNSVAGAMYAFPRIVLPEKSIKAAEAAGQEPDFFYVKQLLEQTGICLVPGSGFGQIPGTFHFRITILPQPECFNRMMDKFKQFHLKFLDEYK